MTTLVTGGTGFLGRRLVERLLAEGRSVSVLGRTPSPELAARGVRFVQASLDDAAGVRAACAGVDVVFHVAAKVGVWGRYDDFYRTNVLGTRALLAGCRAQGVSRFIYTSTPSVVYNGRPLSGADEALPLTNACPSPYPLTKALAEKEVLAANSTELRTIALRPHLIWGMGDPHLVPRILERARAGRLRIVGDGLNRVDLTHIENVADAHFLAERALADLRGPDGNKYGASVAAGRAFFISNGEPVLLWAWINQLLRGLGEPEITTRVPQNVARLTGLLCETAWRAFSLRGEPPMTRFVATELAKDHWFDITAARRDLGYVPRIGMAEGTAELVAALRESRGVGYSAQRVQK